MSSREPPIERLDLRFLAQSNAGRGPNLGMWIVCAVIAVAAAMGSWILGRHLLSQDLAERLANSANPAEALLALESLIQLDPAKQVAIVRGLENTNPSVVKATYRALDGQITLWQIENSESSAQRMSDLAGQLASLPETVSSDNRILASVLAARMYSYCYEKNAPELQPLRELCERIVSRADSGSAARVAATPASSVKALSGVDTQAFSSAQANASGALLEPPSPLRPLARMEQGSAGEEAQLAPVGQLASGQFASGRRSMTLTVSPNATAPVLSFTGAENPEQLPENASSMSLSDYTAADSISGSGVPENFPTSSMVPTPAIPTVARSIGDEGRYSLSVNSEIELAGLQDMPDQQVVRLLGSVQSDVRKAATYELRVRGWPDRDINLAVELATSSEAGRLQLIENIATELDDPRDWLLWMAEDGQPAVRRTAVALLHSMLDVEVERRLRLLLGRENDETVSSTIRQVLFARANPPSLR